MYQTALRDRLVAQGNSLRLRNTLYGLLLGSVLFLYTSSGAGRHFPPVQFYVQAAVLLLFAGWWGWKVIRRQRLVRSPLAVPLLALLGTTTLATVLSVDVRVSVDGLLRTLLLTLVFFLVCDLLLVGWRPSTFIIALLTYVTLLLLKSLSFIIQWHMLWYALQVPEYPSFLIPYRIFGVGEHPNLLAALINLALPFSILGLAQARGVASRASWVLWLLMATVVLFFTRSRGGWIAASVVTSMMAGWLLLQQPRSGHNFISWLWQTRRIWGTTCAYLVLFGLIAIVDNNLASSDFSTNGPGGISTGGSRFTFWRVAWQDFLSHPVLGSGPFTYGHIYVTRSGLPTRFWVAIHAHNVFFNILAEQGIVGVVALGWLIGVGFWTLIRGVAASTNLTERSRNNRLVLVGVCAALAGCLVHSIFDIPTWSRVTAVLVLTLTAVGLQVAGALRSDRRGLSRWTGLMLGIPILLAAVLFQRSAGLEATQQAVHSWTRGDWVAAARALDRATTIDPNLAVYHEHRGYVYSMLADPVGGPGDKAAVNQALMSYERALHLGQTHVPNLLNAATLLDEAGDAQQAEQLLAAAVPQARDWALPALLLAERYFDQGRTVEAEELWVAAFQSEPQARTMAACQRNSGCRDVARRIPIQASKIDRIYAEAQALLNQDQAQQALDILKRIPVSSTDPRPWLDRAAAHVALGQVPQARYALNVARILNADRPATAARAAQTRASLDLATGQPGLAIKNLERAVLPQPVDRPTSAQLFRQINLSGDLLPRLQLLQRTADDLAVYRQLAQLYMQQGRVADAAWAQEQATILAAMLGEDL